LSLHTRTDQQVGPAEFYEETILRGGGDAPHEDRLADERAQITSKYMMRRAVALFLTYWTWPIYSGPAKALPTLY